MNTLQQLKKISLVSYSRRSKLIKDARTHSENVCSVEGYEQSKEGVNMEHSILRRLNTLCGLSNLASYMSYHNDPRGLVIKICSDKMTQTENDYCQKTFVKDWGGDYTIIKLSEWDLYNRYN